MGKKQDDSDDELWLAKIRESKNADFSSISNTPLPPDPWLDGPEPGSVESAPATLAPDPFGAAPVEPPAAADSAPRVEPPAGSPKDPEAAAGDPWAHVGEAPQPPQGEPTRQWTTTRTPPPASMPTIAPRAQDPGMPVTQGPREPMPIPRIEDPWAPQSQEPADAGRAQQVGYEIPRLQPDQAGSSQAQTDQAQNDSADSDQAERGTEPDADDPRGGRHALPEPSTPAPAVPEPFANNRPEQTEPAADRAAPAASPPATGPVPLRQAWEGAPQQGSGQQFGALPAMPGPSAPEPPAFPQQAPVSGPPVSPPTHSPHTGGVPPQHSPARDQPQSGGFPPPQGSPSPQTAGYQASQSAQTGGFQPPQAPQTGAFAAPPQTPSGVPAHLGGQQAAAPSIMPLDLSDGALVKPRKDAPGAGWRRALYKASFGGINPGISREQAEKNALIERIRTPIRGCHKIAVVSLKGGIGKTTTTSCLGLTLAHYRGDRVVALDANPDAGTLAERLTGVTDVSVRDMLDNMDDIRSFTDISRYMSLASRLQVLASDQDAEVSEAFDADQYKRITDLLAQYYNVILTDSGTGMLHSAMRGTLEEADSLVVVGAPSVDGSSRAAKTLDWLVAHGYGHLVARSVAVISSVREKSNAVDMEVLRNHFGSRCRSVIEIPYDSHLVIGGRIDMSQISPQTERAYLELAATVADGFRLQEGGPQQGPIGY